MQPFIEGAATQNALDVGNVWIGDPGTTNTALGTTASLAIMKIPMPAFRCPSDVAPPVNTVGMRNLSGEQTATSNYIVSNDSWRPNRNPNNNAAQNARTGLFIEDEGRAFRDVLDGTSNVVALGERRWQFKRTDPAGGIYLSAAGLVLGDPPTSRQCGTLWRSARGRLCKNQSDLHRY